MKMEGMEPMPNHQRYELATQKRSPLGPTDTGLGRLTVRQLESGLLARFPLADAEPWDRNGLLVGDGSAVVTSVALALDPTPAAIRAAAAAGANVLVTHHPAFLDAPDTFAPDAEWAPMGGQAVYEAASRGVALINIHTPLDASPRAATVLPTLLGLTYEGVLQPIPSSTDAAPKGYGQVCTFDDADGSATMTLAQLAARCVSVFGRSPRVWGAMGTKLSVVATWTGSAGSLLEEARTANMDCLVCGEMKYHTALALSQAGLCIIELGHDVSELPLLMPLALALQECGVADTDIITLDQTRNWTTPEAVRV